MVNRLVLENLRHRPVRTLVSAVAIGVQVTLVLTLVGLSRGMVNDMLERMRGVGADIIIRPPNSSLFSFSSSFPAGLLRVVRDRPETLMATGIFVYPIGGVNSVTGIDLAEFNAMSGGFRYLDGGPMQGPDDILVDNYYAGKRLHAGDAIEVMNRKWHLAGIVEQGKMSRMFVDLARLQDLTANTARLSSIYIKLRDPAQTEPVKASLKEQFENYPVYSMEELTSLVTEANVPMLRQFTDVVIGIGMLVGFLIVFLSMYTAVLERTREIGVLKALGASPALILNVLLRETVLLALCGSVLGVGMNYGARWLIGALVPTMIDAIVPWWWPIAAGISVVGALSGAMYPGLKAARQDVIDALAYE